MKITTFNPFIEAQYADELIKLFGEMGFERHHTKQGIEIADREDTVFRMKDAGGFYLDILQSKAGVYGDTVGIRMNVDDFGAACQLLQKHGFKNFYGDGMVETKSSKSAVMISQSGIVINLIHHIKNHD